MGVTLARIDCLALGTVKDEKRLYLEVADIAGQLVQSQKRRLQPCIVNLESGKPRYPF